MNMPRSSLLQVHLLIPDACRHPAPVPAEQHSQQQQQQQQQAPGKTQSSSLDGTIRAPSSTAYRPRAASYTVGVKVGRKLGTLDSNPSTLSDTLRRSMPVHRALKLWNPAAWPTSKFSHWVHPLPAMCVSSVPMMLQSPLTCTPCRTEPRAGVLCSKCSRAHKGRKHLKAMPATSGVVGRMTV